MVEQYIRESGYSSKVGIYYSKLRPVWVPDPRRMLDLTSFLLAPGFGDRRALVSAPSGRYLTYEQVERDVGVLAAGLYKDVGVRQHDVVMLLSPSCVEVPVIFLAVLSLGAVLTPVNPVNTTAEIRNQMQDAGTKVIFTTSTLRKKVAGVGIPVVILEEDEVVPSFGREATYRLSELLRADPNGVPRAQISQDDTAALLYSSGTTGTSKGVALTHRNFISCISMLNSHDLGIGFDPEILLLVMPMYHVYGLVFGTLASLARGRTIVILPHFKFVEMLTAIQTYRVTHVPLVPPIVISLAKQDVALKFDLSSLLEIVSAAAPLGKDIMIACAKRFPNVRLKQGYALTESTCACTLTPSDGDEEMAAHFGSSGLLVPNMEAMVIDPTTKERMPPSKEGELWIRGPTIMKGYLNKPQATAESVDGNGWLHTGDLVVIDKDGYLYVLDRLKELIKYNALQVAPAELEALLLSHPAVLDCAVTPYPDELAGQIPMAYVVRQPGETLDEDEIMDWVSKQVAPYKKVRKVAFIDAIPKSAAGKILRRELVQLATARSRL